MSDIRWRAALRPFRPIRVLTQLLNSGRSFSLGTDSGIALLRPFEADRMARR